MSGTSSNTTPERTNAAPQPGQLDVSVIVPVRNAEHFVEECLLSVKESRPHEIIVVDGNSCDRSEEIARRYADRVLHDGGRGLPVARSLGVQVATSRWVALVDADVVMPPDGLGRLLDELVEGGYAALQAARDSVSGDGYWGQALVHHERIGRSKSWFGLVATVAERSTLLEHGFDPRFRSGEDIDLRWRMRRAGARVGVSKRVVVQHRYDDSYEAARSQWTMDGYGLARMIIAHRAGALTLLLLPLGGFAWGVGISLLRRELRWLPYFVGYLVFNYAAMASELLAALTRRLRVQAKSVRP